MPKRKKSQQQEQQQRQQEQQQQQEQSPLPAPPSASRLSLHSLPDLALSRVASYLHSASTIVHGLQVTCRFCLTAFAENIGGLTIYIGPVTEDPPPPCTTTRSYAAWLNKHAAVLCSFLSRYPRLTGLGGDMENGALVC